jgi:hypothetical protein
VQNLAAGFVVEVGSGKSLVEMAGSLVVFFLAVKGIAQIVMSTIGRTVVV